MTNLKYMMEGDGTYKTVSEFEDAHETALQAIREAVRVLEWIAGSHNGQAGDEASKYLHKWGLAE